jgi:hypothetical protein
MVTRLYDSLLATVMMLNQILLLFSKNKMCLELFIFIFKDNLLLLLYICD